MAKGGETRGGARRGKQGRGNTCNSINNNNKVKYVYIISLMSQIK